VDVPENGSVPTDTDPSLAFVKVAMSKPHIEYVNSALADWHGSILSLIKAKKEVANDKE
jgi:hypothetical protein